MQLNHQTTEDLPEPVVQPQQPGQELHLSASQLRLILAGFRLPGRRRSLRSTAILALLSAHELELVRRAVLQRKWRPGIFLIAVVLLDLIDLTHAVTLRLLSTINALAVWGWMSVKWHSGLKSSIIEVLDHLLQVMGTTEQLETQLPALALTSGTMHQRAVERISVLMDKLSAQDLRKINARSRGYLLEFLSASIRREKREDAPDLKLEAAIIRCVYHAPDLRFEPCMRMLATGKSGFREQSVREAAAIAAESLLAARQRARISDQLLRPGAQPTDGTDLLRASSETTVPVEELLRATETRTAEVLENRT